MRGLKITHYDCVEDIIEEALDTLCGITDVKYGIDDLEIDVEYVCGCINIVKLGGVPNTLKFKDIDGNWGEDIPQVNSSYANAVYYRLDQLQNLVEAHLTRKNYNNDFLNLD